MIAINEDTKKDNKSIHYYQYKLFYFQERVLIAEALLVSDDIVKTMLKHQAPGHDALVFDSTLFSVHAEKKAASNLSNALVSSSVGSFTIPPLETFITDNYTSQFIDLKVQ